MNLAVFFCFLAAIFVVWVLFGYPLLLAGLARCRARPIRKTFRERSVSVVLPVANGRPWIRRKLESLAALDYPPELIEIIVVSDESTDGTDFAVAEFGDPRVKLLRIPKSGKAAALNHAIAEARGDVLFFTDVRQPIDPQSLRHLVACLEDPEVGVATGELFIHHGNRQEEIKVGLYWEYEKWIRKHLSAIDSILGSTGCIYAMRRELTVPLPAATLLDDVYLPLNAFFRGYRVVVEEQARAYDEPTSLKSEFRRKVRTQAGMYQIIAAYPALLGPRNRMWIHFVSHKLGRLLLPFGLITLLIASFWLPPAMAAVALAIQIVFYGMALMDPWISEGTFFKPATSLVRAFVVLIIAALCAVSILVVPAHRLWTPRAGMLPSAPGLRPETTSKQPSPVKQPSAQ